MTTEEREKIAKAVGSLWAIATVIAEDKVAEAVINTADDLDEMLTKDLKAQEEELKAKLSDEWYRQQIVSPYGATITCNAEGKVDET